MQNFTPVQIALNSPYWYRIVAVAHPFIRLYTSWNIMFSKRTEGVMLELYLKALEFNNVNTESTDLREMNFEIYEI